MSSELREKALDRGARRSSLLFYRFARGFLRRVINPYLRMRAENTEVLDLPGATVLAPVHRSHLDSALLATQSSRRIRALGKESLFTTPGVSYLCAALGAIPVRRGQADRDALKAAKALLDAGETMIVFPEGGRQDGPEVGELFDGAARTSVGYLRIGAFEAVAVPGEMEPGLAQQVRGELGRPDLVVLGLCDDEVGYLMREQEAVHPEFAYERSMSPCKLAGEMVRRALTGR